VRQDDPVQDFRGSSDPVIRPVDDEECLRLLALAPLGRVGLTDGALPAIMPVHFTLWHDEVVFASLPDVKIRSAERGDVLVLEADHFDPATEEGWSVCAIGPARVVRARQEVDALHCRRFTPWAGNSRVTYVAIRPDVLRGRRLGLSAGPG
jgi:nitroimidazol reductase NimA-like FMN-containing flavoprotein (pyridoxamine 5'-phosphate oxidase superfamily)